MPQVIVCGDEVDNSKPHPEIYLTAAKQLGVPPQSCLVVEDAPAGIEVRTNCDSAVTIIRMRLYCMHTAAQQPDWILRYLLGCAMAVNGRATSEVQLK